MNFSESIAGYINNFMGSLADRMSAVGNSFISPVVNGRVKNKLGDDVNNILDINPMVYYNYLENYSYLNNLLQAICEPMLEVIINNSFNIEYAKDPEIEKITNEAIKKFGIKKFIIDHLKEIIKRGAYVAFIDYDKESISEIIDPYTALFIEKNGHILFSEMKNAKFPFYETLIYYEQKRIVDVLTIQEMKEMLLYSKTGKDFADSYGDIEKDKAEKINSDDKTKKDLKKEQLKQSIIADTTKFRGASVFEPYIVGIFHIFLQEYVYNQLSMAEYLKSIYIKSTINNARIDTRTATEVTNFIESLMNQENPNIYMCNKDPDQMLNQINDKLVNMTRVLPESTDFSSLEELKMPDVLGRLEKLKGDIETNKNNTANSISIPSELVIGVGANNNRWEIISRSLKFTDLIVSQLNKISEVICRFSTSYNYYKTKTYIDPSEWHHSFDTDKYLQSFNNKSKVAMLAEKLRETETLLGSINEMSNINLIDKSTFISWIKSEVALADPNLAKCLNISILDSGIMVQNGVGTPEGVNTSFVNQGGGDNGNNNAPTPENMVTQQAGNQNTMPINSNEANPQGIGDIMQNNQNQAIPQGQIMPQQQLTQPIVGGANQQIQTMQPQPQITPYNTVPMMQMQIPMPYMVQSGVVPSQQSVIPQQDVIQQDPGMQANNMIQPNMQYQDQAIPMSQMQQGEENSYIPSRNRQTYKSQGFRNRAEYMNFLQNNNSSQNSDNQDINEENNNTGYIRKRNTYKKS